MACDIADAVAKCHWKLKVYLLNNLYEHIVQEFIYSNNGTLCLKKETRRYYQIQGEMALTKLHEAHLIIYTKKGILVIKVPVDPEFWQSILIKLQIFYHQYMVPEILTQQLKNTFS